MLGFLRRLIGVKPEERATGFQPAAPSAAPPPTIPERVPSRETNGLSRIESRDHPGRYYYSNPMPAWLAELPKIRGDGFSFAYEIAGASHYQTVIETIVGGKREASVYFRVIAIISLEPENPHDPHAIAVRVAGETIGYIKKSDTDRFHKSFEKFGIASDVQCKAKIVGGWDRGGGDTGSFGVRLDIDFPLEIRGAEIAKPIVVDKRYSKIGRLDNVCPNCEVALAKRPGSKSKCQHCGGFIFVRTRPFDRRRVLLTEAEVTTLEAEWTQYHSPQPCSLSSQQ
jgi:hypothetical protein